ncbi:MAG: type II secretion system F family protein, partial [bacterium]|nr:type II secretion system F family protein [bacterium]
MPKFICKARNWEGKIITQEIDGENKEAVVSKLRERGYFVTNIKEKPKEFVLFQRKVANQEIAIFARQFATMIGAGVPLVRCLNILSDQVENPRMQEIIAQIRSDVEAGMTFSKSLEKHPKVFSNLFVNLVKAGEAGGVLDEILDRLANYLESSEQLRQKVKGALTYPVVVMTIAFAVVVFLVTFVLPSFKNIFEGQGELPLPTRVLLASSEFMQSYFPMILIGMVIVGFIIKRFLATKQGIRFRDSNALRVPKLGSMLRKVAVAKFTRTLGTLIASGVPILQALEVTAATAGNVVVADAVHKTRISIREGESIAEP